ncbi:hypothetical protein [Haliscomenobacter hydrossis]|uniref:PKD domain containing protein n=1 Tax=Haliscomenobacter hydrossis (strain ATCC 27775 / DSM 1100 / LMG 10767 / O) TaxID=760192 RepID=F4KY55_HALH1|nr:hypothetical protein [Haliscomenobacter hydrossis]AEE53680.1 PKD domain containing protein [Haliscomenobacter hydrossis DSM 1100]
MIKTRTRSFFVSLLLLMSLLGFGQGIGSPSGGSPGVCPGTSVTLNQALTSPLDYAYEYWDGEGWVCCFGNNQLPYNFSVPSTGQLIEIRRKYTDGATIVKTESLGTFYSPVTPVIGTTVGAPCHQNDGSITVSDHSNNYGAMPRTFQLYNSAGTLLSAAMIGGNTHTFNNLGPGTYRVKILTACSTVQSETTVNVGGAVSPAIEGVTNLCLGYGTQLSASGGTSYLWSNGSTSSSINLSPTAAGSYTYSVTVTNGTCSAVRSHTLTVNPSPSASITGPSGACYNGSIALNASGGGTYSWSTGASTASINVAALQNTQSFTVTVSNSYGCKRSESKTVTVYAPPSLDGTLSVCAGQAATLSVTGGSSYSWNTGETTASISPYPSSTSIYRVTVSDPNACTYVLSKTVSVSNLPDARISGPNTTCAGQNVSLTAFGGSSYLWSTGANTATINVSPGSTTTYTVTVSSSGGCVGSASQVISVHPLPLGNIAGASSVCPGQSTTLSASGGSTYLWNTGASSAAIEVSPTQNTNYTVSITNAQGCTLVKSHSVAVNITGSASNDGPLTCSKTSVNLQGSSGAQGATFQWKNAGGTLIASTANATVTTAGTYTLEIIAAGGCQYSTSTQVLADLAAPVASASNNGPITCTLPAVTLSGSSSTSGSSFQWKNSSGTVLATTASAGVNQAGVYTLLTIGPNGCTSTSTTTVATDVVLPTLSTSNDGPLTCSKTTVTLNASSGNSGVLYVWKNPSNVTISTSAAVVVNAAGIYSVEARGSNGCKTIQPVTVTQNGTLPSINATLVESADEGCTSAQYHFQGSSTTGGVGYEWRNSFDRLVSSAASFYTRIPGTYTLKVIAADGCSSTISKTTTWPTTSVDLRVDNNQVVNTQADYFYRTAELSCTKTTVVLNAQSWDNHTYVWSNQWGQALSTGNTYTVYQAGTYLLKSTDGNGCTETKEIRVTKNTSIPNLGIYGDSLVCEGSATVLSALGSGWGHVWNTGVSASSITTAGIYEPTTYSVTVNYGSCQSSLSRTVRVKGVRPTPGTAGPTTPCTGTPVSYIASGGTIYRWSTGETTALISVPAGFQNTNNVNYWVDVSNASGCTSRKSFTVRPKASPVAQLNGAPTAPFCGQGTVNLSASGGSTYLWSTGETTASLQKTLLASTNLSVRVSSSNGCSNTKGVDIVVNPLPQAQILGGEMACNGDNTTLSATGGSTYLWSTGATTSSIALTQPTTTQTYSVTVSTGPGCSGVAQKTVIVPAALSLNYTRANVEDCTANNASVLPIVTGGQGNISLSIARYGELYFSPSLNGLRSGTYVLKAEDNQQCIALKEVVIEEKQPAPAIDLPDVEVCAGATASLSINNAAAYTTFLWSNGATTSSITVSPTTITTYTITATASNGCQATDEVVVRVNPILTLSAGGNQTFCLPFGSSANATLFASVNGGTAPYTYQWYSGQTTASISVSTPASAGFGVVVSDSKGCTASASASVIVIPLPQAQITGGEINCYGSSTVLTATGGETYLWNTGATTASIAVTPSSSTYYSVTVSNGICAAVPTGKMVLVPEALSLSHQLENDDDCIVHNAVIVPSATGGQGDKIFKIARNGELYFSETLIGLASGNYILVAEDSVGCTISQEVEIKESPVVIDSLTLQGVDDCVPGNTQLVIATTGDRLPLLYRLNGQLVSGPTITLPAAAGDYSIEVEDAAGCKATRNEYYPVFDTLTVEVTPITDCNNPYGSIQFLVEGWSVDQMSSSIDSGQTWVAGNQIDNLASGFYSTMVRNTQNNCVIVGTTVQLDTLDCPSLIGFTKDTILITSAYTIANLPLAVNYPQWFGQTGKVKIRIQGDGFPHFFGNSPRTNLQLPELRGEVGIDRLLSYPPGFIRPDTVAYPLSDSAEYYLFPAVYTFNLIEVPGSLLKIDPDRRTLRVIVRFGPPETVEEQVISVCDPSQCPISIGENFGTGYCYSWEGPITSDQVGKAEISVCPSTETLYTQKILDINTFELVKINTYRIKVGGMKLAIVSNLPSHELCAGKEAILSAYSLKDGNLITQSKDLKFQWSTGETTNPITVKPAKNKNYKIYVTELKSGCVSQAEDYVLVRSNPSVILIPINPLVCKQGENYLPTEVKVANPITGLSYMWSNGATGDKVLVNQPGAYTVTATTTAGCKAEAKIQVEENTAVKALSSIDGNFYKLPAKITPVGANDNLDLELGSGGMIENHTAFSDFNLEKSGGSSSVSCISALQGIMNAVLFNEVADKKVLLLDKSTSCRNPSILAQAKAEILKHQLGFILFMDDSPGAGTIHILGSNFKDRYTPVSGEHSNFVDTRLVYLEAKNQLPDIGVSLHVALNSLVDNFTMTYVDMSAGINGLETVPGVTLPELRTEETPDCKYDLNAPTNFLTPAAIVVTLEMGATPFFRYKSEIADLAQMGAITGFTDNFLSHYGRFWPPQAKAGIDDYYFIGYDNITSTPQNSWDLYAFPTAFLKDQLLKIWWGNIAGVDATKIFELDYVNQKATLQLTGEGDFPTGGDVTTVKKGPVDPTIVSHSNYIGFQVEKSQPPALTPNQLTLWSIKMGRSYDRTDVLIERTGELDLRDGYIVHIPKDPNEVDASKGFYQVYVKFYTNQELPEYYYFDEFLCKWEPFTEITDEEILRAFRRLPSLKVLRALYDFARTVGDAVYDGGHIFFDIAGLANPGFDIANAIWYFAQGRTADGVVSIIGAVPGFGDGVVVVKKVAVVVGATTYFVIKLFLKNGEEITSWIRTLKYTDEAGNIVEAIVKFDDILDDLGASNIPVEDLKILLGQMTNPNFTGPEAARILKAIENDPGIITRNYDLLANSPLLQTNLEVLFKFDELIKGGLSRLKLREILEGPFGDILDKAAQKGDDQLKALLDILGQPHVDDFYLSELNRRLNTYPDVAQDLLDNPAWLKEYDELVQDPSKFWELYRQGSFDPNGALAKWGKGFMFKSLVATAEQFEKVAVKNLLRSEGALLAEGVTLIITKPGEAPVEIVVDFLVRDPDGLLRIVDAKYTTKAPFNTTTSLTPNQTKAFPWIKDMANSPIQIEVRANPVKLKDIGLTQGDIISNIKGIDLYVSNPSDPTTVGGKLGF